MIEKKTVSMCSTSEYCRGWNDAVDEFHKYWDANQQGIPADMVPMDFHDRCMEAVIGRRITLEREHKKTVAEVCELRDQVHNLTLYLDAIWDYVNPQVREWMDARFSGMPGYAPTLKEAIK